MTKSNRHVNFSRDTAFIFLAAFVLFVISSILVSGFASITNFRVILTLASFVGIAAAGQTVVVLTGGIDLSIPWVMTSGAFLLGDLAHSNGALTWAIPAVLLYGAAIGAINGLGVAFVGVSPIIMTLAMDTILSGFSYQLNTNLSGNVPSLISNLSSSHIGPFTIDVFIWAIVGILVFTFLMVTVPGRSIYAVGSNAQVARFSGIRVKATLVIAYSLSGVTSVCAGIIVAGYASQSYAGMGNPYLFTSIAALAVGGVSIYGGFGSYAGVVAGVFIITCLGVLFGAMSLGPAVLDVVYGVVIIIAMLLMKARGTNNQNFVIRRNKFLGFLNLPTRASNSEKLTTAPNEDA
jgi:ribose transport system permease protein